jgi:hypothetical protein
MEQTDIQSIVQQALEEFVRQQSAQSEPAYKVELREERKRREQLEKRLNELVEENQRSRQMAAEAERGAAIRSELQRLGVAKVDLAYRAVQDAITRAEDGRLIARNDSGDVPVKEYLAGFVAENPEFLPARISGGSGVTSSQRAISGGGEAIDLDKIRPGMSREEMERARQEIVRIASQNMK